MKEYAEKIANTINEEHGLFSANVVEIAKMNDEMNIGIQLKEGNSNIGSIHYVNGYFDSGISIEDCAKEMVEMATLNRGAIEQEEKIRLMDENKLTWDEVKDFIGLRLINIEYNTKYLADKMYRDLGNGFALTFDIVNGNYRATITKGLAEVLGCDEVMLICASQASNVGTPVLCDLADRLMSNEPKNWLEGEETTNTSMMVLTASDTDFGAAMIYKGVGDKIAKVIGDYYLLPSSVHEWIVVPESAGIAVEELRDMVSGANRTVVDRRDLLAYGVYKWTKNGLERVA